MARDGHFHCSIKLGRRSRGQSAVAAAAYRAGAQLKDARQGITFDFTKKEEVVDNFILAPPGAPDWTQDREQVWNAVEAAEPRKDAQLWREIEVSIPREIPPDRRADFIRDACQKYVEAGVICDVAIHNPQAADGGEQPHAHIMLSLRSLDSERETGFAHKKDALDPIFSSGGRYGGTKGEKMKRERARWAEVSNKHLRAAKSLTRVDSRSYQDRGIKRDPEPKIGEVAAERYRRGHGPSNHQQIVSAQRAKKRTQDAIIASHIKECTMQSEATKPTNPQQKSDFKAKLIREFFPDLKKIDREALWRITQQKDRIRIAMRDGSMIDYKTSTPQSQQESLRYFGGPGKQSQAATLAQQIADEQELDAKPEFIPAALAADSPKKRKKPLTDDERSTLADRWRARGFTDVDETRKGVAIHLQDGSKLHDTGNRVTLSGPVSDEAVGAMITKAREEWNNRIECWGGQQFLDAAWLEAQRQGVDFSVKNQPDWQPSAEYQQAWEREQASIVTAQATEAQALDKLDTAKAVIAYARGDRAEPPNGFSLTEDQKNTVAGLEPIEAAAKLPEFAADEQDEQKAQEHTKKQEPQPEVGDFKAPGPRM